MSSELCNELNRRNYRPVMMFGDTGSGKTSLILSLLSGLRKWAIAFRLDDEPLVPLQTEYGMKVYRDTRNFFYDALPAFIAEKKTERTIIEFPIYVPIIVTHPHTKQEIKLAFLESNGEWYREIGSDSTQRVAASHKSEIYEVLTEFEGGITCIYVAPYMNKDSVYKEVSELWHANMALYKVLTTYTAERKQNRDNDSHLFVLNKWDDFRSPYNEKEQKEFVDPDWGDVEEWVKSNYKQAWVEFHRMARITKNKSSLMFDSAGRYDEKIACLIEVNETAGLPTYASMRELLWDWLIQSTDSGIGGFFPANEQR